MRNYFLKTYPTGSITIFYEENGYLISFTDSDPANTDYQAYLAWVAEGNTAEQWTPETNA